MRYDLEFGGIFNSSLEGNLGSQDPKEWGDYVNGEADRFVEHFKLDGEDKDSVYSAAESKLKEYRTKMNEPRFVPSQEEFQQIAPPLPLEKPGQSIEEKAKALDVWKEETKSLFEKERPAQKEDIGVYLEGYTNNLIRDAAAKTNRTSTAGDLAYRFTEGILKPVHFLADADGAERFWAEGAPEDPTTDENISSMVAGGVGDAVGQVGLVLLATALTSPAGGVTASTAYNTSRYMKQGYEEEWKRSGDEEKASAAAVSQIPAAILETVGDTVMAGLGKSARGIAKEFAEATTEEAKRKILAKAVPSLTKDLANNFITEAIPGGIGAEWASGAGMYLATGNEEYLRSGEDLLKSGLVEGLAGAIVGTPVNRLSQGKVNRQIANETGVLATETKDIRSMQNDIFEALKARDFKRVAEITDNKIITDTDEIKDRMESYDASRGLYTDARGEATTTPQPTPDTSTEDGKRKVYNEFVGSHYRRNTFSDKNPNSEFSILSKKADRTEQENKRLDYLTKTKAEIEAGTYKPGDLTIAKADIPNHGFFGPANNGFIGGYQVNLDNGEALEQGDSDSVLYLTGKGLAETRKLLTSLQATYGEVSFIPSDREGVINVGFRDADGKVKIASQGGKRLEIPATFRPTKGSLPVQFMDMGDSINFSIGNSLVKEAKQVPTDFEVVSNNIDKDGSLVVKSKRKSSDGTQKEVTLTGDVAKAALRMHGDKAETRQKAKEAIEKRKQDNLAKKEELRRQKEALKEEKKKKPEDKDLDSKIKDVEDQESKVDEDEKSIDEANKIIETEEKELEPSDTDPSVLEELEKSEEKQKNRAGKVKPLEDTLGGSVNRRAVFEGQQGIVKKTEDGRFEFVSDSGTSYELSGNDESTLESVGISRNVTNPPVDQKIEEVNVPETPATLTRVKEELKKYFNNPKLDKKIDNLSDSAVFVIGNAMNRGFTYELVSREDFVNITKNERAKSDSVPAVSKYDKDTDTIRNLFVKASMERLGQKEFEAVLTEETFHGAAHRVLQNNPELWDAAGNEILLDKELDKAMRGFYPSWDKLSKDGKTFEAIRAINQGRYTGKPSNAFGKLLQKFLDYVNDLFGTSKNKNIQVLTINVEKFLGVERKGDRNAIAIYNKIVRGQELSEDDQSESRDIFRDVANMLGISANGSKQDLIDRFQEYQADIRYQEDIEDANDNAFAEIVPSSKVESLSIKGNYGAWIHPNADLNKVKASYGHDWVAQKEVEKENSKFTKDQIKQAKSSNFWNDLLLDNNYVRVVNRFDKILVEARSPLTSSQKKTLEWIGMNDEKNVIQYLPNGSERIIYNHDAVSDIPFAESGDRFTFRLAPEFKNADTVLGLKIANDGTLPVENLNAKIKKSGVNEFEIEKLTELVSELAKDGRVNIKELSDIVDTEPTLVINTLDVAGVSEYDKMLHEYETSGKGIPTFVADSLEGRDKNSLTKEEIKDLTDEFGNIVYTSISYYKVGRSMDEVVMNPPKEEFEKALKFEQLGKARSNTISQSATGRYGVDPYSINQLNGTDEISPGHKLIWSGDLSLNVPTDIKGSKQKTFPKFESQHYRGEVAENQLAFVRGGIHEYQPGTQLPDGTIAKDVTRIMEIWEVQSDWQGKENKFKDKIKSYKKSDLTTEVVEDSVLIKVKGQSSTLYLTKQQAKDAGFDVNKYEENEVISKEDNNLLMDKWASLEEDTSSPLLKYWESLALKAAVNHAQKQGATNIIVSDAETAMMTESHDDIGDNYEFANVDKDGDMKDGDIIENASYDNGNFKMPEGWIFRNDITTFYTMRDGSNGAIPGKKAQGPDGNIYRLTTYDNKTIRADLLKKSKPKISQEKGMRAAYDQRVPNTLAKITGSKPKKVTVGIHGKADKIIDNDNIGEHTVVNSNGDIIESDFSTEEEARIFAKEYTEANNEQFTYKSREVIPPTIQKGSTVFKEGDFITPKSTNTGRMFTVPANKNVSREIPFAESPNNTDPVEEMAARAINFADPKKLTKLKDTYSKLRAAKEKAGTAYGEYNSARSITALDNSISKQEEELFPYARDSNGNLIRNSSGMTYRDLVTNYLKSPKTYPIKGTPETPFAENFIPEQNQQPQYEDAEIPGLFGIPGQITEERKAKIKQLQKIKATRIEAKLSPEDKEAFNALRNLKNGSMLSEESFDKYVSLMSEFIETRAKVITDKVERASSGEVLRMAAEFKLEADQNMFDQLQDEFFDIPAGENQTLGDRTFESFNKDLDQVRILIQESARLDDFAGVGKVNELRESFLERIDTLREMNSEDLDSFKKQALARLDEVEFVENPGMFGWKHIAKGVGLMKDTMNDMRKFYDAYVDYLMTADVESLNDRQVRDMYYSLMGVTYDSYMLSADNFISGDTMEILRSNSGSFTSAFRSNRDWRKSERSVSGTGTETRRLSGNREALLALHRLTARFDESIKKARMFHQDVMVQYQKDVEKRTEGMMGRKMTDQDRWRLGIVARALEIRDDQTPQEAAENAKERLLHSFSQYDVSGDPALRSSSFAHRTFTERIFNGATGDNANEIIRQNAIKELGAYGKDLYSYYESLKDFFDVFEPMAKFTTEFVYGRQYHRFSNYMPSMVINLNKGVENTREAGEVAFNMSHSDLGEVNINKSGMASTHDRVKRLDQGQALILNINHLFSNRGKLNFLDYFSAVSRREMSEMISKKGSESHKALANFLGDPRGQNGRLETFAAAQMMKWNNVITATQYIHPIMGLINNFAGRWAGSVLSSAYQLVSQTFSNIVPYFQVNIMNPSKIGNFFEALTLLTKYKTGMLSPEKTDLLSKLLFDIENRKQDVVMDTSVSLSPGKIKDWFKSIPGFEALEYLDTKREKIQFFQFEWSDMIGGMPILLTEYLNNVRKATGNNTITFETLDHYDPASYFAALDETERFIAIGDVSRRGEWMNNRKGHVTVLRHILTGFAGHRINNATNFGVELKKVMSDDVSKSDKLKSLNYMAAIGTQSAVFTILKANVLMLMMSVIKGVTDTGEEDDELEKLYAKKDNAMSKEQKKLLEIEIAKRRELRKIWNKVQQKQDSEYFAKVSLGKDIFANISIVANVAEFVPNIVLWQTSDIQEAEQFREIKNLKLAELKKKEKNARNLGEYTLANKFKAEASDLSSLEAVQVTSPNFSQIPFQGMYGGVAKNAFDFTRAVIDDKFLGVEEMNMKDWGMFMGALGYNVADMNKYLNILEDIEKAQSEAVKKEMDFAGERN